jgi:hypothetical protein
MRITTSYNYSDQDFWVNGNLYTTGRTYIDNTTNYFAYPSGDYGSVVIQGGGKNGWEGYSIADRYVLMSDDNNTVGLYNDINNRWIWLFENNDRLDFYEPDGGTVFFRIDNSEIYTYVSNRFSDNANLRLGNGADFRMYHDGSHTYFRNFNHPAGNLYWQGENTAGSNRALLYMRNDTTRNYLQFYEYGSERMRTISTGVQIYGTLRATGDVIAYSSDRRLKENIVNIDGALDKISKINGVFFDWKDMIDDLGFIPSRKKNDIGVIAQEIEAIIPQAVEKAPFDTEHCTETGERYSKSGEDYLTVKYEKIVPLLIEGIKELKSENDSLKDELAEMKSMMKKLLGE